MSKNRFRKFQKLNSESEQVMIAYLKLLLSLLLLLMMMMMIHIRPCYAGPCHHGMVGASSGCGWRRRPPDVEGSCEYIE
jgi:hypothetical protein